MFNKLKNKIFKKSKSNVDKSHSIKKKNTSAKKKRKKSKKQGIVGVNYRQDIQKWVASMVKNNKQYNFGSYANYNEAVSVRREAEKNYDNIDAFKKEIDIKIAEKKRTRLKGFIPTIRNNTTSGVVGVSKTNNEWQAYIDKNKIKLNLGKYETYEEAVAIRKKAEKNYDNIEKFAKQVREKQNKKREKKRKIKRELDKAFKKKQIELEIAHKINKITITGVTLNRENAKWEVKIQKLGKVYRFGLFNDYDEAVEVRRNAEDRYYDIQVFHKEFLAKRPLKNNSLKSFITQEELKKILTYDPNTGVFTYLVGRQRNNNKAGYFSANSIYITIKKKKMIASHLAFLYMTGNIPKKIIYIDGDRTNNKWSNLESKK